MGKEDQATNKELFQEHSSNWVITESDSFTTRSSMESSQENSTNSIASSSSSDLAEDASSDSNSHSSSSSSSISFASPNSTLSNGPLFELSELMVHLPLRRGLSKFYQGKSQSFTSLASVKSAEDLPKKVAPYRKSGNKAMKSCKSYGSELHSPKAVIAKKSPRGSSFLASQPGSYRPSLPMQNNC